MFMIGCHLSIAKGFTAAAHDARSVDGNTFQFFTRNPRGGKAKALDPEDIAQFRSLCTGKLALPEGEAAVDDSPFIAGILAHAPYTLNPCSNKPATCEFATNTLIDDLARLEHTPYQLYNMHPGSHVGQGVETGIEKIADALNAALAPDQTTTLLLETMAGKGSEVGRTFEELRAIIDRVELADHVGICFDTCHVWDAGYDIVGDLDGVLEEFDRVLGLDRLRAVHLNDSKNPLGAHKDRHEKLGDGCIGWEALVRVINHPVLRDLPFYLETPQDSLDGYADEIARLKEARA